MKQIFKGIIQEKMSWIQGDLNLHPEEAPRPFQNGPRTVNNQTYASETGLNKPDFKDKEQPLG